MHGCESGRVEKEIDGDEFQSMTMSKGEVICELEW